MTLYLNNTAKLKEIKEKSFKLEKDMQKLFEENLNTIMGLELVKSEFTIKNKRIDTLAFDKQAGAFIIIEYKRDKNMTENQIQATNFKDIAIELWEVKQFENNTITISPIKKSNSAESIKPLTQNKENLKKVTEQIKVYTEQDHFKNGSDISNELYEKFKTAILNLSDDIEVQPKKLYIAFKKGKNIADVNIHKKSLVFWINLKKGKLDDPKGIAEDVSEKGHWGNGDYQIQIENDENLEYIMSLIKQAIEK